MTPPYQLCYSVFRNCKNSFSAFFLYQCKKVKHIIQDKTPVLRKTLRVFFLLFIFIFDHWFYASFYSFNVSSYLFHSLSIIVFFSVCVTDLRGCLPLVTFYHTLLTSFSRLPWDLQFYL